MIHVERRAVRVFLKRKLKDNRGASMIIVLCLFLVCMMVSSIIIAAAVSGGSRNLRRTEQQRAYLAVVSAKDLFVDEIKLMGDCVISGGYVDEFASSVNGPLKDLMYRAVKHVYENGTDYTEVIKLQLEGAESAKLPEVIATFVMKPNFTFTIDLTTSENVYTIKIMVSAQVIDGNKIDWYNVRVYRGGA